MGKRYTGKNQKEDWFQKSEVQQEVVRDTIEQEACVWLIIGLVEE